jgi:Phage protein (N4 Gp49/phage Sf6 gene 66) family
MSDIEQEIQAKGKTAPRVTPADVEANIAGEHYFTAAEAMGRITESMVDRFLAWKLPADFSPDCGISFAKEGEFNHPEFGRTKREPSGTNLFDANQARAMLEHVIQQAPVHPSMGLLTFCVLILRNGFTVTGESACASPENFDAEIGRKIARENAVQKMWSLMGYALKEKLSVVHVPVTGSAL